LTHDTRLRVDHTYPEQEAYVLLLSTIFSSLVATEPKISIRKADSRTGKIYKSIYFKTLRFFCLNEYYDLFYKENKKVVPSNILKLLTPRGLAHLIMGDGLLKKDQGVLLLCTESFTKEDPELLVECLDSKFGIKSALNRIISSTGVVKYRIRISKISMDKLIILVKPYFIPEMLYKLGV